jgi:hypothetical protein
MQVNHGKNPSKKGSKLLLSQPKPQQLVGALKARKSLQSFSFSVNWRFSSSRWCRTLPSFLRNCS